MNTNLQYINQICTDLGGTGGHVTNLAGENEICTLLGGTGGHTLEIDALNEICTLQSVTGSHSLNLEALKSIGANSFKTNLEAWSYIQSSSVLNYNPAIDSDVTFYSSERSGLSLVDTKGNNASILLPSARFGSGAKKATLTDYTKLDPVGSSFTLCGWMKRDTAQLGSLFGKMDDDAKYGFLTLATGILRAYYITSGGTYFIENAVAVNTLGWIFVLMEVDISTSKFRYFINGTQVGSDVSFTGSYAASTGNTMQFALTGKNEPTSGVSYSDVQYFDRLLTPTEKTTLLNHGFVSTPIAHYPCHDVYMNDVSGNNNHLTISAGNELTLIYSEYGSRYLLDYGFDEYGKWLESTTGTNKVFQQVPLTTTGLSLTSPNLISGTAKLKTFAGSLVNHNLADSKVRFTGNQFDRSNTTIYKAAARLGYYDSGNVKDWHISELNKEKFLLFFNESYKNIAFTKYSKSDYFEKNMLLELFTCTSNKSGSELNRVISYCQDNGIHAIEYTYSTDNIITVKDLKWLKYNDTGLLYLSLDGGATYAITKDISADVSGLITYAHIFDSGTIMFCSHTKIYYSTNNLSTYHESTVLGIDGSAFTPSTYDNFKPINTPQPATIGGSEVLVWGNYSIHSGTMYTNINVWYSFDGITVKSAAKAGTGSMPSCRHIHAVAFDANTNKFYVTTGDSNSEIYFGSLEYNSISDNWVWQTIATAPTPSTASLLKMGGLVIHNGNLIIAVDQQDLTVNGVQKCIINAITTPAQINRIYNPNNAKLNKAISLSPMAFDGNTYISGKVGLKVFLTSVDGGVTWIENEIIAPFLLYAGSGAFVQVEKSSNDYWKMQMTTEADGADIVTAFVNMTKGPVVLFKIIKP